MLLILPFQCQIQFQAAGNFNNISNTHLNITTPTQATNQFGNKNVPAPNLSFAPIFSQTVISKEAARESAQRLSEGAYKFSMELFGKISDVAQSGRHDFMISPFAVWSLLLLLLEGSEGNTYSELRKGLYIEQDMPSIRKAFRDVQNFLK